MSLIKIEDRGGDSIQFFEVDGIRYPYCSLIDQEQAIKAARDFVPRDNDILLITYIKSGTHWLWEILSMLQRGSAETIPQVKQDCFIEFLSPTQLDAIPSPRVLNSHIWFDKIPTAMIEKKTKIVVCHRNPKDVAVSLYHHHFGLKNHYDYDGKWENWFPLFMEGQYDYGSWFDYVLGWDKAIKENPDYPIHVLTYEDLKTNGLEEVQKLSKFLGFNYDDDLCSAIVDKCHFRNMKIDKQPFATEYLKSMWRNESLSFYRKGEVGDWKNMFTVAQNEAFDALYEQRMKGSDLTFKFE
ncbi:hypothetical protein ACF0H5_013714 [Mactra antiquata]